MKTGNEHTYDVALEWEGNRGEGTRTYAGYGRGYRARTAGKADLLGSADSAFRGDAAMHNPEDLLVIAVSSCHMLSYLALCAKYGVNVVAYSDRAHGVMVTEGDGGRFREIVLRPRVIVAPGADLDKAGSLHADAARTCFIHASCNFPIRHEPSVAVAGEEECLD